MITKKDFIETCKLLKETSETARQLYKLNVDLMEYNEKFYTIQNKLLIGLFGKLQAEAIVDFTTGDWDGKIYIGDKKELIKDFGELYDWLQKNKS